jgi:hypothetical protein
LLLLDLLWLLLSWGKFKCEKGGRAQEQRCTLEEGCIKGTWYREYKRQKNKKCKGRAEGTKADMTEQCNRTTTGLVSH